MRDRYYRIRSSADLPDRAALVQLGRRKGRPTGRLLSSAEGMDTDPDLALFAAALARVQDDLVAIFVIVEDEGLWQAEWGDLVDYRVRPGAAPAIRAAVSAATRA